MEVQLTQGQYIARHAHGHLDDDVVISAKVKKGALAIAMEKNVKLRYRKAARGIKALTLSKEIWEEAYKSLDDGT